MKDINESREQNLLPETTSIKGSGLNYKRRICELDSLCRHFLSGSIRSIKILMEYGERYSKDPKTVGYYYWMDITKFNGYIDPKILHYRSPGLEHLRFVKMDLYITSDDKCKIEDRYSTVIWQEEDLARFEDFIEKKVDTLDVNINFDAAVNGITDFKITFHRDYRYDMDETYFDLEMDGIKCEDFGKDNNIGLIIEFF